MQSYIEALHLRGVRQFSELNVHFNAGFNFIAGPNGCGKTSILTAIAHCFQHSALQYSRFSENAEFWTDLTLNEEKFRIGLGPNSIDSFSYRNSRLDRWNMPPESSGRTTIVAHQVETVLKYTPLFIGSQRRIRYQQIAGVQRESDTQAQLKLHLSRSVASIAGEWQSDVKQWFVNRYFVIDKDWAHEEKANWLHLIEELPNIGPFDSDFKYVRTERDLEPIFSINGRECYLEELSSGFQAILLVIANIIEWIEGTRPAGSRSVNLAGGTVLIDELDIHLHPEWQFNIRDGLSRIFPNIQFIVTTHSPHLLASAKANEVIIMPQSIGEDECNLYPIGRSFSGWNTDQILSEIMGVSSLNNRQYERLVASALDCIQNRDITGLKLAIENLSSACHPNDTILVVMRVRLAAMEALASD